MSRPPLQPPRADAFYRPSRPAALRPSSAARALLPLLAALAACAPAATTDAGLGDAAALDGALTDALANDAPRAVYTGPRPPDRALGAREGRALRCDPIDPLRCMLPWPSNSFAANDAASATRLRVRVDPTLAGPGDSIAPLVRADGFSRATPVAAGFEGRVDPASLGDGATGALRVFVAAPGEGAPREAPMRLTALTGRSAGRDESLVLAYPRAPFAPATDHVVVVLDSLRGSAGERFAPSIATRVALGLEPPADADEAALYAYHAPARAVLARAGVDPARVLRVWDFTTRSADDPRVALRTMRDAARAAVETPAVAVRIDEVTAPEGGVLAAVVRGALTGLPDFREPNGALRRDAAGRPVRTGAHDAPFRVTIPRGEGSYRVVLYGHGTGGNERDDAFDRELGGAGAAKVGVRFQGLTDEDTVATFESLRTMLSGGDALTGKLLQSYADALALLHALRGSLGDALAAPMLGGRANPAAGRRPDVARALWAGGSLGGTSGLVLSSAEPDLVGAVLNVPGAAWTHFLPLSNLFPAALLFLRTTYRTDVDIQLAIATGQGVLDEVDGAAWADARDPAPPRLLQESIGDPVLPNAGTDFAATATRAGFIGAPIVPIPGVAPLERYAGGAAITQYRVPATVTSALDIHGFGAKGSPAGEAAREQIVAFVQSVWAGSPQVLVPALCARNTPANSCDFRGAP